MLSDQQIIAQNRWWDDDSWEASDPHLRDLAIQPVKVPASVVDRIDLSIAGIHILRGPRQVGKSTDLKLITKKALEQGLDRQRVIYIAFDLLEGSPLVDVARTIERAKELIRARSSCIMLLDEVTSINNWQNVVKSLWDGGTLRDDVVICTGSSSIDLQKGAAERLPGRRGAGVDHLALPQSFATFAKAIDDKIPASPGLSLADIVASDGREVLNDHLVFKPKLERAFELYLRFGGLPAALAEAATGKVEPSEQTRRILYDSIVKEVMRRGASIPATNALLERILRSLGSKISWDRLAREMGVPLGRSRSAHPSGATVRDYMEFLASNYFAIIVYFWRAGSTTSAHSKEKKVYFADPLLHTVALKLVPGRPTNVAALVENVIGLTLYLKYEPQERIVETFVLPDRLHIWRTHRGGEVDFVCGPRNELDILDVKYQEHPSRNTAAGMASAFRGRPVILATKSDLSFTDRYALVPASMLAWALG